MGYFAVGFPDEDRLGSGSDMSHRRAFLSLMILGGVLMGPGLPAQAATKSVPVEGTNWYWTAQNRQTPSGAAKDATGQDVNCPPGTPVCPDPQVGAPNPHEPGALPVQMVQGEDQKVSAIQFDLPIPSFGAVIDSFTFSVTESPDPRDQSQTVNAGNKKIKACLITEIWPASLEAGADEMEDAPEWSESSCAEGKRKDGSPPKWEFDIKTLAQTWGTDPTTSYGVMLVGVKVADQTDPWQLVLKGPYRDPETSKLEGKKNIEAKIAFTPNQAPSIGGFIGSGFNPGTSFGNPTTFGTTPGSTSTFPGTTTPPATTPGAAPVASQGNTPPPAPSMPGWFWLLIPVGLIGLSLVRHTVIEPLPGKRADGVVALIRRHNAARLGRPLGQEVEGFVVAMTSSLRRAGQRIRSLSRRVLSGGRSR